MTGLREYSNCDFYANLEAGDNEDSVNFTPNSNYYDFDQFHNSIANHASLNKLSLIHYNARSLNKHFDKLCEDLHVLKFPFSIIGVTETWMTSASSNFSLKGYNFFFIPS